MTDRYRQHPAPIVSNASWNRVPMLDAERERELAIRWREAGDAAARDELILAHSRLVGRVARRYARYGLAHADLMQEGFIGLLRAAERYEPERGLRFSTYALWCVRSAVQDYVLRNWSVVRTGTTSASKALFFKMGHLRAKYAAGSGDAAAAIAREMEVSRDSVRRMMGRTASGDLSLNAPVSGSDQNELQELLVDASPSPEECVARHHDIGVQMHHLEKAMDALSPRERCIVRDRHMAERATPLRQLAETFGVSKERIRQIEIKALQKLRAALDAGIGPEAGGVEEARASSAGLSLSTA